MKLNESKDKIPATFITSYISDAWEKIGYINEDINAVKKEYSDTKIVVECLQDIVDAYLVAAGRLQAYLDGKEHIDTETAKENQEKAIKEELTPIVNTTTVQATVDTPTTIATPKAAPKVAPATQTVLESIKSEAKSDDVFEYTCDFDEPDAVDINQVELDPSIFGNMMK